MQEREVSGSSSTTHVQSGLRKRHGATDPTDKLLRAKHPVTPQQQPQLSIPSWPCSGRISSLRLLLQKTLSQASLLRAGKKSSLGNKQPVQRTPNLQVLSALKHDMRSAKVPSGRQFLPKPRCPAPDPQLGFPRIHRDCRTRRGSCGQANGAPVSPCRGGGSGWAPVPPREPHPHHCAQGAAVERKGNQSYFWSLVLLFSTPTHNPAKIYLQELDFNGPREN